MSECAIERVRELLEERGWRPPSPRIPISGASPDEFAMLTVVDGPPAGALTVQEAFDIAFADVEDPCELDGAWRTFAATVAPLTLLVDANETEFVYAWERRQRSISAVLAALRVAARPDAG